MIELCLEFRKNLRHLSIIFEDFHAMKPINESHQRGMSRRLWDTNIFRPY
jgi:hypothetical protein